MIKESQKTSSKHHIKEIKILLQIKKFLGSKGEQKITCCLASLTSHSMVVGSGRWEKVHVACVIVLFVTRNTILLTKRPTPQKNPVQ